MIDDRDLLDSVWNRYLKPYQDKYRCFCDELGIWSIRCKNGFIQPYSIAKQQLVYIGDYATKRKLTYFFKRICKNERYGVQNTQEGDTDGSISFPESNIKKLANLFEIKKKRKISAKRFKELQKQARKMREQKWRDAP